MPTEHELMRHERMRWNTMTVRQLRTRVSRIRNPTKLRCFARMCEERSNNYLAAAAIERAGQLGVPYLPMRLVGFGEPVQSGDSDYTQQMDRALRHTSIKTPVEDRWSLVCPVCGLNRGRWGECEFCKRGAEQKTKERAEEAEKKKRTGVRLIRFKRKSSLDK